MTALASPLDLYELGMAARSLTLRRRDGTQTAIPIARWLGPTQAFDDTVLSLARGPVLDVGCGPGRHLAALRRAGVPAHGIDLSQRAVRTARRSGADVTHGCVFGPLPGAGTYASVLLLDGNIGIGGDAAALLRRCAALVLPARGRIFAEVEPPGSGTRRDYVRLELGRRRSTWFAWAHVDAEGIGAVAADAGLVVERLVDREHRWLAVLAG